MESPKIADSKPVLVELEKDKNYAWCSCGQSSKQPFCDGSHRGSGFSPKSIRIDEAKKYAICLCKHSKNAPFCDGSHSKLTE